MTTEAERRYAIEQAIANTKIEGHEPTPDFLADMEQLAKGAMTPAETRAASLARALAAEAEASVGGQAN